jgi:type I restriction enzyme, S subunit
VLKVSTFSFVTHTRFKKTQLGEIPQDWNIVKLDEVSTKIIDMDHKMPKKSDHGIPFVSVGYLGKNKSPFLDIRNNDEDLEFISEEDYEYYSKRFNAEYSDLLISRYGTIGVTKMINTKAKLLASYSIALIKLNKNLVVPLFLTYFLNNSIVKKQVLFMTQISSNTNLGVLDIKKIRICVPTVEEQHKIASIISTIDMNISKEQDRKYKLEHLKRGLMQKLLTGKIRLKA